jgi:hypothetical protein
MEGLEIVNLAQPTEARELSHGRLEVFEIASQVIKRASYHPGRRWPEHVSRLVGTDLGPTEHLGLMIAGGARARWPMEPGDLFAISAGHDSWVGGGDPYVSLHFSGANTYAAETI